MTSIVRQDPDWAARKFASLTLLTVAIVAAMSAWFATTASLAAIRQHWVLTPFYEALLTSSVQAGFVIGTLTSALLSLPDRFDLQNLFCASALIACIANLLILLCEPTSIAVPLLRLVTGMCMAGIYPVGMKLASTWAKGDLGLLMGLLVGALTLGSSLPHALAGLGGVDWRIPIAGAAAGTLLAAMLIRFVAIGAPLAAAPPLQPRNALQAFRNRPLLLANLGYFGHMWELYAMWAWIGPFLAASFAARYADTPPLDPRYAAFAVVAAGAIGCLGGGWSADRWGRTLVTIVSMAISGSCAVLIGFSYGGPAAITLAVALVWGITVISDSAQFSASVSELSDRSLTGTMLTVQMCVGFLITLLSIHLIPYAFDTMGWRWAFATLAIGPALGVVAMSRLRARSEAQKLAGGKR
ncbi:MFS transporter [Roseiterribacter gracilis]|uniref:MFS transporter n=1 Tax=Roseiterribacter gracilis TaxID=2812848 RepID=A0A8S8XFW2_9PROT|nr:MFS transporter [Rhodospirillales bacterium TMPK1]